MPGKGAELKAFILHHVPGVPKEACGAGAATVSSWQEEKSAMLRRRKPLPAVPNRKESRLQSFVTMIDQRRSNMANKPISL